MIQYDEMLHNVFMLQNLILNMLHARDNVKVLFIRSLKKIFIIILLYFVKVDIIILFILKIKYIFIK